uniref:Uncharacterized protein n=1 Tax=Picea sitchensis TaxID=3332 RepID=D5ADC4_PICSI|nr:unknown [Picea sitchensis]
MAVARREIKMQTFHREIKMQTFHLMKGLQNYVAHHPFYMNYYSLQFL